jgi:hypothetical protein
MDKHLTFVLGAQDPEMREIEQAAARAGAAFVHAIDPNKLLFLRASWRAMVTKRSLGDVVEGILDAAKQVQRHYDSESGESVFLDPTETPPDLPEGAAYAGKPVRYRQRLADGGLKEMLKGATPEHIGRFMAGHEEAGRVVYGNPYRGYAGAYIP